MLVVMIAAIIDESVNVKVKEEKTLEGVISGFAYGTSDYGLSCTDLGIYQGGISPNIVIVSVDKEKYEVPTTSSEYSDMIGEKVNIKVVTRERKGKLYDVSAMFV